MRDPGLLLVDMLTWLLEKKPEPLRVVECGTIRHPSFEGHEDGLATYHIARWMARHRSTKHAFYSFELTAGHLEACRQFLQADGLDDYVTFGLGDADLLLEHFCQPIDVCYLDAGADPVANLSQYRRAEKWLRPPGMIVIDDVFDPRNADRGLVTVPYARLEGHKVACIDGRLALISFGVDDYPLPANSYWLPEAQTEPQLAEVRGAALAAVSTWRELTDETKGYAVEADWSFHAAIDKLAAVLDPQAEYVRRVMTGEAPLTDDEKGRAMQSARDAALGGEGA